MAAIWAPENRYRIWFEVEALAARKAALVAQVAEAQQRLGAEAHAEARQRELERDVTLVNSLYDTMLTRLRQIGTEQGLQHADAYVAVEARPAEEPAAPRTRMILVGIFFTALGVGTAAGAGLSLRSQAFRAPGEVEERTGLLVLGAFARPRRGRSPQTMVLDDPFSAEAEELHRIAAGLVRRAAGADRPLGRVVLVTSALPGEGKTAFAIALGHTAARAGLATLVVDGDLRRAGLSKLPPAGQAAAPQAPRPATPEDSPFAEVVVDLRSGMRLLPLRGPVTNPHEFLGSAQLPKLLDGLRQRHDLVILDTPPALSVADALTLARFADEVILVADWTRTDRGVLADTLRGFERAGIAVGGAVLSKLDLRRHGRPEAGRYAPAARRLTPATLRSQNGG
jgi:Mrp family chromosome partitioning ATPase